MAEPSVRAHQVLPELDVNPLEGIHDDQLLRKVVSTQLQRKEKHIIKGGIKVQRAENAGMMSNKEGLIVTAGTYRTWQNLAYR